LGRAALALVVVTVGQVGACRLLDPPFTLTMLSAAWDAPDGPRWVARSDRPVSELGHVPAAFVASEDARFWLHRGFDWDGICGAVVKNATGSGLRGGSTLTQQTAKNVFLWQGRSWIRKGLETWYALWMELLLGKERILELYLTVAETGPATFGAEAGARHWFGRAARDLTPEEAARLAGILPSPRRWTPNGDAAASRARHVAANPAPWPGRPGFDAAVKRWDGGNGPLCLPGAVWSAVRGGGR
jgi:monofunctional biosynthetic peptidoglycan transglycosylase